MSTEENLEISIFKDIDASKTIIAAVMNPSVNRGVGSMMFRLLPVLGTAMGTMTYTGDLRNVIITPLEEGSKYNPTVNVETDYSEVSAKNVNFSISNKFFVFGGAAYHLHKTNDNSPFSHILPGVHDVDVDFHSKITGEGVPPNYEHPFSRSCINRLKDGISSNSGKNVSVLNQPDNILSSILNRMITTIRHHILYETQAPKRIDSVYDLFIGGRIHTVRLNPPFTAGIEDPDLVYSEVVSNFYRIRVVDEGRMLKVQVEIKARDIDAGFSAMDHAFEVVMLVSMNNDSLTQQFVNIRGINVFSKERLFNKNMASLLDRSTVATKLGLDDTNGILSAGKCAQDFLRVVYLLLDGLNSPKPRWVETKSFTKIFGVRSGKYGGEKNMQEMVTRLGHFATPIEVFMFITRYIQPCVQMSNISAIDVFRDVESKTRTRTLGRDFRAIVDTFQNSFSQSLELLAHREDINRSVVEILQQEIQATKDSKRRVVSHVILSKAKTRLEHYLARDFEINVDLSIGEEEYGRARVVREAGILSLSADDYIDGEVVSVIGHHIRNKNWYSFKLGNGEDVTVFIDDFIRAFVQKYPETGEDYEYMDEFWYKFYLEQK